MTTLRDAAENATAGVPVTAGWKRTELRIHPDFPPRVDFTADPIVAEMWRGHPYTALLEPLAPLSELDTARAEIERLRAYAETITAVVRAVAPLAGSEAVTQVNGAYYADPAFYAHRIAEQRQAAHDGQVAKVKAVRAESALTAAQARIAEQQRALELAEGRIALLLQVFPDADGESDHPTATQYVLDNIRTTLSPAVKEPTDV